MDADRLLILIFVPLAVVSVATFIQMSRGTHPRQLREKADQQRLRDLSALKTGALIAELPESPRDEAIQGQADALRGALRGALPQPAPAEGRALRYQARQLFGEACRSGSRSALRSASQALAQIYAQTPGTGGDVVEGVADAVAGPLLEAFPALDTRLAALLAVAEGVQRTDGRLPMLPTLKAIAARPGGEALHRFGLVEQLMTGAPGRDWPLPAKALPCPEDLPPPMSGADLYLHVGRLDIAAEVALAAAESLRHSMGATHPIAIKALGGAVSAALRWGQLTDLDKALTRYCANLLAYARAPLAAPSEAGLRALRMTEEIKPVLTQMIPGMLDYDRFELARSTSLWMQDVIDALASDLEETDSKKLARETTWALRRIDLRDEARQAGFSDPRDGISPELPPLVSRLQPGEAAARGTAARVVIDATWPVQRGAEGARQLSALWQDVAQNGHVREREILLGRMLDAARRMDKKKTVLGPARDHLTEMERVFPTSAPEISKARNLLIEALRETGGHQATGERVDLLNKALELAEDDYGAGSPEWLYAAGRLVVTLSEIGEDTRAIAMQKRRIAAMIAERGELQISVAAERAYLGDLLRRSKDLEASAAAYSAAVVTLRKAQPPETALEAAEQTMADIARWLLGAGRRDEAREALEQARDTFRLYADDPSYPEIAEALEAAEDWLAEEFGAS